MKIRNKLFLGFGLLFIVVLFFGVVSVYYIEKISETTKVTLKNNYQTLTYTREMRSVLDENDLPLSSVAVQSFDNSLKKQESNITESGEREATADARKDFGVLTDPAQNPVQKQAAERNLRSELKKIEGLNMQAIVAKDNATHATVNRASLYLGAMGFITFLILFVLIANFPGFIVNPVHELTDALQDISKKNYDTRLSFSTSNEFAQLSLAYNAMAVSLGDSEISHLSRILSEEIRIKALIEEMDDAVFGLNKKQEFLFINSAARKILGIDEKNVTGKPANGLGKNSSLLKTILENKNTDDPLKISLGGKTSYLKQKNIAIVVPNLKPNQLDAIQFSGHDAGTIYVLKDVSELNLVGGE
jgi:nitrogen fixation/metabolism regulation signal transduction histidine kinase